MESAAGKTRQLEDLVGKVAEMLHCSPVVIVSTLEMVINSQAKEKMWKMEDQAIKDRQKIDTLVNQPDAAEKKLEEHLQVRKLLNAAVTSVQESLKVKPLDLLEENLVEKYLSTANPSTLAKVIECYNRFAKKISGAFDQMHKALADAKSIMGPVKIWLSDSGSPPPDLAERRVEDTPPGFEKTEFRFPSISPSIDCDHSTKF